MSNEKTTRKPKKKSVKITKRITKDGEIFQAFDSRLTSCIEENDFLTSYELINEAKEFVDAGKLTKKSLNLLRSFYEKKIEKKLEELGFVDVSNKILSTTFYCMTQSCNLALRGPPGVGKSFFAKSVLPHLWVQDGELPTVMTIQPDRNMDVASLIVEKGLKEGSTVPEKGQIHDAMTKANDGKRVILVLEEINQWPPKVLKDLNDFLQERRIEKKISEMDIILECPKENLLVIANYNPEGETLGEDETGSVSSRFIFCDLQFPSREDIQKIIALNINEREFRPLRVGFERKKVCTKQFLRAMSDVCYSIRSAIQQGDLGMMAMQLGTRHIINFSRALFENNTITEAIMKTLVDPILEKYVREGIKANVEPKIYEDYVRTIFKAVKQVLGTKEPINEKSLKSLKKGLDITASELFKLRSQEAFIIDLNETPKNKSSAKIEKVKKKVAKTAKRKVRKKPITKELEELGIDVSKRSQKQEKPEKEDARDPLIQSIDKHLKPRLKTGKKKEVQEEKITEKVEHEKKSTTEKKVTRSKTVGGLICPKCGEEMKIVVNKKRTLVCQKCMKLIELPIFGDINVTDKICKKHGYGIFEIDYEKSDPYCICPECFDRKHKTCNVCDEDCI
ncbi:MAG: AAA family ATPase [Candidatus Helarchaeota archaeon]